MTVEHHELVQEFPEFKDKIHELKVSDHHFAKLFAEYDEVDKEVRRIEQEVETPADSYVEEVKRKRVMLKDQLYAILAKS